MTIPDIHAQCDKLIGYDPKTVEEMADFGYDGITGVRCARALKILLPIIEREANSACNCASCQEKRDALKAIQREFES